MKPLCLLIVAMLAGCATTKEAAIFASGEVLEFDGHITSEAAKRFVALASSGTFKKLHIASGGGDVEAGIAMARYVHSHAMDVEVSTYCLSSCANYIFPAANNKYITGNGIVGWHGTITHLRYLGQVEPDRFDVNQAALQTRLSALEDVFYKEIGVDGFMCWFAKLPPYSVKKFYLLSQEDMEFFGLHNLHVRPRYAETYLDGYNANEANLVRFVQLDRTNLNAMRPVGFD
jgi:hypothetical protein